VVPGVLFSSRPIETENARLLDIGPTVLDLFGVPVPEYMDGKALAVGDIPSLLHNQRENSTEDPF
jgi:arylsulfatase A-like enzyme